MSIRQFICTTKNDQFNGKLCGLQFTNGRAVISSLTIDQKLGFSVEQVVQSLKKDFGHDVVEFMESEAEPQEMMMGAADVAPAKKKGRNAK